MFEHVLKMSLWKVEEVLWERKTFNEFKIIFHLNSWDWYWMMMMNFTKTLISIFLCLFTYELQFVFTSTFYSAEKRNETWVSRKISEFSLLVFPVDFSSYRT